MKLQYHIILNKTYLAADGVEIRNQIYSLWKNYWLKIYADQGSSHVPMADDFHRHDLFSVLVTDSRQVVGFLAHTLLDFQNMATLDLDYFQMFGPEYAQTLQQRGIHRVLTFESLIVRPEFRHNAWNLPLSRLLIRLDSCYLLAETSAAAGMAVSRSDNSVVSNSFYIGWESVQKEKLCRGFPCDLQVLPQGTQISPEEDVTIPHAEMLWAGRVVHQGEAFVGNMARRPTLVRAA